MVLQGKQNRVIWIDFDSSQTFTEGFFAERQEGWVGSGG